MSKSLLLKLVVFLFILLSAVVCESGKIEELFEVELWHWTLCIYGSSLVCCSLQRFPLVLLCFLHWKNPNCNGSDILGFNVIQIDCYSVSPLPCLVSVVICECFKRHSLGNCDGLCPLSLITLPSKLLWCLNFCFRLCWKTWKNVMTWKPGKDLKFNCKNMSCY